MKIVISYPPLSNEKGYPTLGQNRQFQYFKKPTFIYPVVPAQAATLLKGSGHQVIWNDCIAQGWDQDKFLHFIMEEKPDLIAFETKTPVVKQHWKIINDLKKSAFSGHRLLTVLFGDHVTALPEESFHESQVDYVLTGGDYDFLLQNLCNSLSKNPDKPSAKLEPGIYYHDNGHISNTGKFELSHDLNTLPLIDRDLTRWQLYAFENGNYKRTPGAYIMSARDCWWHKCTYCAWTVLYPDFRARSPKNVLDEIGMLIEKYNVREIMDDSGCFPVGDWLREFCVGMIERGYNKKVYFDCNMRFGALSETDLAFMKKANFRLLLFGLESLNPKTIEKINKNIKIEKIVAECKSAAKAGLFPHITVMFGYPWEDHADALRTLKMSRWLLKKGYAYTMQATIVIPYPGTPIFEECRQKDLLRTLNWEEYDMRQPVIKTSISDQEISNLIQGMYKISFDPEFIFQKLRNLKDKDDLKYYLRAAKKITGHISDFERTQANRQ